LFKKSQFLRKYSGRHLKVFSNIELKKQAKTYLNGLIILLTYEVDAILATLNFGNKISQQSITIFAIAKFSHKKLVGKIAASMSLSFQNTLIKYSKRIQNIARFLVNLLFHFKKPNYLWANS